MHQPSILVVDDELLIRDLLYDFFSGQGWQITVAESSEKALQVLKDRTVDLVLTDIKMPELDGLQLATQLRESRPDLPVVVMTGYPSVDSAVSALRARVADYVIKPFNINQLFKLLEATIQKQQER